MFLNVFFYEFFVLAKETNRKKEKKREPALRAWRSVATPTNQPTNVFDFIKLILRDPKSRSK